MKNLYLIGSDLLKKADRYNYWDSNKTLQPNKYDGKMLSWLKRNKGKALLGAGIAAAGAYGVNEYTKKKS